MHVVVADEIGECRVILVFTICWGGGDRCTGKDLRTEHGLRADRDSEDAECLQRAATAEVAAGEPLFWNGGVCPLGRLVRHELPLTEPMRLDDVCLGSGQR